MAAPTKNQKIEALAKLVQKRSRGAGLTSPPQRTVLETLMYAALLENATFDKADVAYTVLENYYIDWNEIRVCSVRELADTLTDLPRPEAAAERVRKALQGIFEKTYTFDLEDLRKKGKALAEHIKFLESIPAGSPYMIQYTAQVALDGHLIPFDESSLRIMRRLGLSQLSSDGTQEICVGLDRVILKKSSLTFAAQLHHFAVGYYDVPDSPELLSQLSAIDADAVGRNWTSPILITPAQSRAITLVSVPIGVSEDVTKQETPVVKPDVPKETGKATPVVKPTKPESKPVPKKLPAKPVKKPVKKPAPKKPVPKKPVKTKSMPKKSVKTVAKPPKKPSKPVKPIAKVKKTSSKKPKVSPSKKAQRKKVLPKKVLPKKVQPKKPVKPLPKKKVKVVVKNSAANPGKKLKGVSPTKALRKKKPK